MKVHNDLRESISNGSFVAKNETMPAAAIPIPDLVRQIWMFVLEK